MTLDWIFFVALQQVKRYWIIRSIYYHSDKYLVTIVMSQLDGNSPNLGKYSIRKEEPSDDLRVGSFYRSQRSETSDKETKAQDAISTEKLERPNSDNVKPLVKESSSKLIDNDPKIQALEERFNTKKRPRHEANKQSDLRKISPSYHEKLETHLILDTTKASEDGDATHESVVVNLNPAILLDGVTDESSGQDYSKNTSLFENFVLYTPNLPKQMRKKKYPKRMPYDKIMLDVTFVLSGYENPRRSQLRDKALEMGATYKPNWCRTCTHLM